ncbi:MAG: helix-turn-helix transcriptional regulator [Bryobacterales bacterium]|nr:helix-turn-helix transcriptional regulator [Bryobacterales bacterium]
MSAGLTHSPGEEWPLSSGGAPRLLCEGRWPGIGFAVKEQDISRSITWAIHDERHAVVVHLGGPICRLETELAGVGSVMEPPLPGEVWLVPARERYSSLAQGGVVRYAELFLDTRVPGGLLESCRLRPLAGHYDGFLQQAVTRLQQLSLEKDDLAGMLSHALSQAVMLHVFREFSLNGAGQSLQPAGARLDPRAERAIEEYVWGNLAGPITLGSLASVVRLGVHELLRRFRGSFGSTPAQYVIEQRLRRARWLLATTTHDITRIALDTGFCSHGHLSTTFHKRLGMTPSQYRAGQRRLAGAQDRMRVNR